jgi:hypothetical protein
MSPYEDFIWNMIFNNLGDVDVTQIIFPMGQQPLVGQGLLIVEVRKSHSGTLQSVALLWIGNRPFAETST